MDSQQQQFCLKWNSFGSNLATAFSNLFKSESLADVTLFCEGTTFRAHKLILAACSKHFQELFDAAPPSHAGACYVILEATSAANMAALLEFMYKGEVHVSQEALSGFLKSAESLQVKGLSIEHEKLAVAQSQQHHGRVKVNHQQHQQQTDGPDSPSAGAAAGTGGAAYGLAAYGALPAHAHYAGARYASAAPAALPAHLPPPHRTRPPAAHALHYTPAPPLAHHRASAGTPTSDPRASVLRDGKVKLEEPLGSPPQRYEPDTRSSPPRPASSAASSAADAIDEDTPAEGECKPLPPPHPLASHTHQGAEDLRVKMEIGDYASTGGGPYSAPPTPTGLSYDSKPQPADTSPSASPQTVPPVPPAPDIWTAKLASNKSGGIATPDGKKLKCPFCERLYGYETNLRAHIRQRHQGIRVPCPYCARTFTRNNTVRRHIAREHKHDAALKLHPGALHNHAQ